LDFWLSLVIPGGSLLAQAKTPFVALSQPRRQSQAQRKLLFLKEMQ